MNDDGTFQTLCQRAVTVKMAIPVLRSKFSDPGLKLKAYFYEK